MPEKVSWGKDRQKIAEAVARKVLRDIGLRIPADGRLPPKLEQAIERMRENYLKSQKSENHAD